MELIQKYNIFEFHDGMLWRQLIGVAMGIRPAPSFANNYMARRIDPKIEELGIKYGTNNESAFILFKRFLDDNLKIFKGTTKELHYLFNDMNKIHPTLKFTLNHTTPENEADCDHCNCEAKTSVPFLDTSISIEQGKIEVDLYTKETDRNQYLLPSSCHPKTTTKSIPFSLSLRIIRICTKTQDRDKRLGELKELLLARDYPELLIESAIKKALKIPRKIALLKVKTKNTVRNRPVFCLKYDPRLPAIQTIQARHWRSMKYQDKYMEEVFKEPPLTAFKKTKKYKRYFNQVKSSSSTQQIPKQGS